MIVVTGIESAAVGWFEREGRVGVVYSFDRIRIQLEKDGLNPKEIREISGVLQDWVDATNGDDEDLFPILVHTADYEELVHRDKTGDYKT